MHRANSLSILLVVLGLAAAAHGDIVLLGKTSFTGDASDRSGLEGKMEDGTPQNRLGGLGSSIAYTGQGNRYLMVPDRGPGDGAASFRSRMHIVEITVKGEVRPEVAASLKETVLLKDEEGRSFLGLASAFDAARPAASLRFDPEGVRVGRDGTLFIADEYGPSIYQFSPTGKRLRSVKLPAKLRVTQPRAREDEEIKANQSGRVTNKGMEGLAITPNGRKLVGAMQAPLIQDGGRMGLNCRLVEIDLASGASREFVYTLSKPGLGLSEILAVNDHEFLVIERESKPGKEAEFKKIFRINLDGATDVSDRATLPRDRLAKGVVAVKKQLLIDLLDVRFGLAGPDFPAKIEGLAFGPDLPDGRKLLVVTSDNDFNPAHPTWIFAFALDKASLPRYVPQVIDGKK